MKLKKIIVEFMALTVMLISISGYANAALINDGLCNSKETVSWAFYSDGLLEIIGKGEMDSFSSVSEAGYCSYILSDEVKSVVISDTVSKVGDYNFYGCGASYVSLSSAVKAIGSYAFYGMTRLESLTIPASVRKIGENAFTCSPKLTVEVANGNSFFKTDEYGVLYNADVTEMIFFPAALDIKEYTVPSTVTLIHENALNSVLSLEKVILPVSLTEIGAGAFSGCTNLNEICYLGSKSQLDSILMDNCGIDKNDISCGYCFHENTVQESGVAASCSVPGYNGEMHCADCLDVVKAREIVTVAHIDSDSDKICDECDKEYTSVVCAEFADADKNIIWTFSENGSLEFFGTGKLPDCSSAEPDYKQYSNSIKTVTVNNGITDIGDASFKNLPYLEKVTIGNDVKNIGISAFENDSRLADVDGCEGLETIGDKAFSECSLTEFSFGGSLVRIGNESFVNCGFKSVSLPSSLENVGNNAFYSCKELESIVISKRLNILGDNVFGLCDKLESIEVDVANVAFEDVNGVLFNKSGTVLIKYPSAHKSNTYKFPENVKEISPYAFENCKNITAIEFNSGLECINESVFKGCMSLLDAELPESISALGTGIFTDCINLETVVYPYGLQTVPSDAFYGCSNLKYVSFGDKLTEICENAFALCSSLEVIIIDAIQQTGGNYVVDETGNESFAASKKHFADHKKTVKEGKAPVCIYDGYTGGEYCEECDWWTKSNSVIPAEYTSHDMKEYEAVKAPTCLESGEERACCSRCDYFESREIPLNGHSYNSEVIPSTCITKGYTLYTCDCGYSYTDDYSDSFGDHILSDYITVRESSCSVKGEERADCENCDYYKIRLLPFKSHTYVKNKVVDPTCTDEGYTVYMCECNAAKSDDTVPALGHSFSKTFTVDSKATCYSKGSKSRHCERCNAVTGKTDIDYTSHMRKKIITPASFSENGTITETCTVCGKNLSTTYISGVSSLSIAYTSVTYDGRVKTPTVTVKDSAGKVLKQGTDYKLQYSQGRTKIGSYSVKVILTGNYSGDKTLSFRITPKNVSKVTAKPSGTSVDLYWKKVEGATGYRVYIYNDKTKKYDFIRETKGLSAKLKSEADGELITYGSNYKFAVKAYSVVGDEKIESVSYKSVSTATKPKKASLKKLSSSSRKIKIRWNKQSCDGYEILYATNKSFSNAKKKVIKSKSTSSYTVKKAKKGKNYYVKIRAYKIVSGKKIYGYYSSVRKIKVR